MKTLIMTFQSQSGSKVSYRLAEPKDGLTAPEVQAAMQTILATNIFSTTSGELAAIVGAGITDEQTTTLI